jgi:hypothetical protein
VHGLCSESHVWPLASCLASLGLSLLCKKWEWWQ